MAEEMTGYVVCRWYRAPEIILNWMHYNSNGKHAVYLLVRILQDQAPASWMHYNSYSKPAVYFLVRILQDQAQASWMHYNSHGKMAYSLNAEPSLSLF